MSIFLGATRWYQGPEASDAAGLVHAVPHTFIILLSRRRAVRPLQPITEALNMREGNTCWCLHWLLPILDQAWP